MGDKAQFYAFLGRHKVEASDAMVICTILIYDCIIVVLFNLGSIFSYISIRFSFGFDMVCEMLDTYMYMSTLVGVSIIVD